MNLGLGTKHTFKEVNGRSVSVLCCTSEPRDSLFVILLYSLPVQITASKEALRTVITLLSCAHDKGYTELFVLRDTLSIKEA